MDQRRPGYSRAKEELRKLLRATVVEREIVAQQRLAGQGDPEYFEAKARLITLLKTHKPGPSSQGSL